MGVSLLINQKIPPSIGELVLDCNLTESHQYRNKVTRFPVEEGSDITDHIQNEPDRISLTGFVTNAPIRFLGIPSSSDLANPQGVSRSEYAYFLLLEIHRTRKLVNIVTNLTEYENMAMESLTIPRSARIGDVLEFSASFIAVRKVATEVVATENIAAASSGAKAGAKDQASTTKNKTKTNTSEATGAATEKVSIAKGIVNRLAGVRL